MSDLRNGDRVEANVGHDLYPHWLPAIVMDPEVVRAPGSENMAVVEISEEAKGSALAGKEICLPLTHLRVAT